MSIPKQTLFIRLFTSNLIPKLNKSSELTFFLPNCVDFIETACVTDLLRGFTTKRQQLQSFPIYPVLFWGCLQYKS